MSQVVSIPSSEVLLAAAVLTWPSESEKALSVVGREDFGDGRLFDVIADVSRDPDAPLSVRVEALAAANGRDQSPWTVLLGQLADEGDWIRHAHVEADIVRLASAVRAGSLRRQIQHAHARLARDFGDDGAAADLRRLTEELKEIDGGTATPEARDHVAALDLSAAGFTGARIRALRERPQLASPLPGFLDPEPHLHVVCGRPKSAKTTLVLALGRAWCLGLAPWEGAPALPGSRFLVISREQAATRIDAVVRRMQAFALRGDHDGWTDRTTIIARDAELCPEARRLLTLDDTGLALLHASLAKARSDGDPYGLVLLDSLSRLKPPDVEERDNDALTAWLDRLEEIASSTGSYVLLIHHQGHTGDPTRSEARSAGRGASSIAAVAQVVWLLERSATAPNQRILKVDGNAILPAEITLEVASETADVGAVHYFRPCDPIAAHSIDDHLTAGEEISTSELAWRLSGKTRETGKRPPGTAQELAARLRDRWAREGLVEKFQAGQAINLRRKTT